MRVLAACSLGGAGHLQPLLPFLAAARREGNDLLVAGPPALEAMVEQAGYPFHAGAEPDADDVASIRERLALDPPAEASILGNRRLFGDLATAAMLPSMYEVSRRWRPDLVLREPCEYASAVVFGSLGVRSAQVAISSAAGELHSIAVAAPALEQHRAGLTEELGHMPYLTRFPPSLDPSSFPVTLRYREPAPPPARPLPDWWGGSDGPLIYVTFGSVLGYMSVAQHVYRAAVAALSGFGDARVLLTVGRGFDPSTLGSLPPNLHVESWVDHQDVLAAADLVVCHGGSGTVFGALAAGVPLVVVPVFADQFDNARQVAASGAGLAVHEARAAGQSEIVVDRSRVARIARSVRAVLSERAYRRSAVRIAGEMAGAMTIDQVLARLIQG